MIIPAYLTAHLPDGTAIRKEDHLRRFHVGEPHANQPEVCMAWPGIGAPADARYHALFRLFEYAALPWQAASVSIWNASVAGFMCRRAYIGCLDASLLVAEWQRFRNPPPPAGQREVCSHVGIAARARAANASAVAFVDTMLPEFSASIDAVISEYETAAPAI